MSGLRLCFSATLLFALTQVQVSDVRSDPPPMPMPFTHPTPGTDTSSHAQPVSVDVSAARASTPELAHNSISCGAANRGSLSEAAAMPRRGRGFEVPEPWWSRGHRYGTAELVGLLERVAASVDDQQPGGILAVADLSAEHGGAIPGHRSHQSGRDADLIFYAIDKQGSPFMPDQHMAYYSYSGRATYAKAPKYTRRIAERYFDLPRNWALVKALMDDPHAEVEHMFVSHRVRRWLLRYAETSGEDEAVIKRARRLLKQPQSTGGHNDHMHIRVSCTQDDQSLGRCKNSIYKRRGRHKFYSRIRCPVSRPAEIPTSE